MVERQPTEIGQRELHARRNMEITMSTLELTILELTKWHAEQAKHVHAIQNRASLVAGTALLAWALSGCSSPSEKNYASPPLNASETARNEPPPKKEQNGSVANEAKPAGETGGPGEIVGRDRSGGGEAPGR